MDEVNRSNANMGSVPALSKTNASPWLTVHDAAQRARCGVKTIYREVHARRLRAARIGGRRELRLLPEWIDQWLVETTTTDNEIDGSGDDDGNVRGMTRNRPSQPGTARPRKENS